MKKASCLLVAVSVFCAAISTFAQINFTGTNASSAGSNFTFTVGAGATNLSVTLSNNVTAYSYVLLKKGGAPTDTSFDFISRIKGQTNQINLELPEYAATNYGLRISTPATSTGQVFKAVLTTNRADLRSAAYPVLKPLVFSTTGFLTNNGGAAWHYFQVDVPSNLLTGWRLVVSSTNASNPALYVRRGLLPDTGSYDKLSSAPTVETVTFSSAEATNSTYFIGVYLPAGTSNFSNYKLSAELASTTTLTWDPGTTDAGTQVFTNQSASGGDYFFAITTQGTANNIWRTALNVLGGEADVYLLQGALPATNSYSYNSARVGSDGFVLAQGTHFSPGQNWYLLVHAAPGAQWNLVTGEAYVQPLPSLAADGSSSGTNVTMGAEGMHFFKTTITTNTLAWRLWLNGLTNQMYVKQTAAPHPYNTSTYDLTQPGQMLVVPTYLNPGSQYFVGVTGNPGLAFSLDSRQQAVTTIAFNTTNTVNVTGYGYTTFLVQVPVQQIAWQVNVIPTVGSPNVAVRRDNVPNEFVNDAYSDVSGGVGNSVTLVPPTLSNGSFYVTVYGSGAYTCTFFNGQPVITTVNYTFAITNDAPNRVGWRYYTVVNTSNQLGTLGWELDLTNAPAGTEIAIRRNAVPSQWNYRNNPYDSYAFNTLGYVDLSSVLGFLQQPNHPADVWYIGVYSPAAALGNFVLTGTQLTGPAVGFDGAGSSTNVVNQPAGKFQYVSITVPTNALGWDLRLTNVTSGSPTLFVCRDQLPSLGNSYYWTPQYSASWPSGYQWQAGFDWTTEYYDPDATYTYGRLLAMGLGNPLEAGTYYVGVINNSTTNPISYTLVSRGIGTNFTIPVTSLAFTNGVVTKTNLAGREAAYYSVVVPTNVPSWRLELGTNAGESLLMVEKDSLPSVGASGYASYFLYGGRKMQKTGNEQYLLLPPNGQTNVIAGTYYLAVASEGVNPSGSTLGTGASSYTLNSFGSLNLTNLGTVDPNGVIDLIITNSASKAGQASGYQFNVPSNTLSLEVFLENKTGNPVMTLQTGNQLPTGYDGYGLDGGQNYTWNDLNLINIPNPTVTNYTLMVQAMASGGNASYRVRVHAIGPQPVAFDNGSWAITNQGYNLWQYFIINVPSNCLGWDLRLTNVTATNSAQPFVYICRDTAPSLNNPNYWVPQYSTAWPSGYQWQAGYDWTSEYYNPDGSYAYGRLLAMGMGNPLQAGTYYVGVINTSGQSPISYTLLSRGIGTNLTIPVTSLAFTNGVITKTNVAGRETAYYSVVVPTNMPSWRVEMNANIGDALLTVQKDALPNVSAGNYASYNLYGGRKMQKVGNEQYALLPLNGTNIIAGTYYLAVTSEGMNPVGNILGTNSSSFTLSSFGSLNVSNIGTVDNTGATDIIITNSSEGGQIKLFQFAVPTNTLSLEVHLENKTGNPAMTLLAGSQFPGGYDANYGIDGGQGYTWNDLNLINIANPAVTNYTLLVQAVAVGGDATYQVRLHALGPQPLAFDNGAASITNQAPNNWQYFIINVPSNCLGWDVRLTNVTATNGAQPYLYICRDTAPSLNNPSYLYWYPPSSTSWPSTYQWEAGYDWTGDYYNSNGTYLYGQLLAMGMGNPLQAGTYYVGVINTSGGSPISYTLLSRGIGTNLTIPVTSLAFSNGVVTNLSLAPREAAYYKVIVPTNIPDWKVRLSNVSGETLLVMEKDSLPNTTPGNYAPYYLNGGRKMQKAGNEQYLLLPLSGQSNVIAGTYYLAVVSEGINPSGGTIGTNTSAFTLATYGVQGVTNLGTVGVADLLQTNALQGGENAFYQFAIPAGLSAVEVRLDNVAGYPYMTMQTGANLPSLYYNYGFDGGVNYSWSSPTLITLPNPTVTNYTLGVQASYNNGYPDANFTVHVRQMPTPTLVFDASLNGGGSSNVATGTLLSGQSAFYQVTVPATVGGQPVIGWKLDVAQTSGSAGLRIRSGVLPDDYNYYDGTSPFVTSEGIYVSPYLTPGIWYVEVRGTGITSYTLTSSNLGLKRAPWTMQSAGGSVTTPGLPASGPLFGDTGVGTDGQPLPGDQGTDLAQGNFDYYEIIIPTNNTGVLRTRMDAISGNPNLYIRAGAPSSLSHYTYGTYGSAMYDRLLNGNGGSEYGNWVPFDGRHEAYLTPGPWYLAVQASGNSNVRYRLRLDNGNIKSLALNGGSYTNQLLAAGDWQYYSVVMPTNAPVNWNVTFTTQLGNVAMYVRDRVPPGTASTVTDYRDWNNDNKNHGPYANPTTPGSYTLNTPPLRPGNTYYLGFHALSDSSFSLNDSTSGGTIDYTNTLAFYNGYTTNNIPAFGQLKFRIDVPGDATQWIHTTVHSASVWLYLDQGSAPTLTTSDDWYSQNNPNQGLSVSLQNASSWPWLPGYSYFLNVTNTSGSTQPFSFSMTGGGPVGFTEFTGVQALPGNGGFKLDAMVVPGGMYQLQVSTDLISWSTLTTFTASSNTYTYTDTTLGLAHRFYRLIPQ